MGAFFVFMKPGSQLIENIVINWGDIIFRPSSLSFISELR